MLRILLHLAPLMIRNADKGGTTGGGGTPTVAELTQRVKDAEAAKIKADGERDEAIKERDAAKDALEKGETQLVKDAQAAQQKAEGERETAIKERDAAVTAQAEAEKARDTAVTAKTDAEKERDAAKIEATKIREDAAKAGIKLDAVNTPAEEGKKAGGEEAGKTPQDQLASIFNKARP